MKRKEGEEREEKEGEEGKGREGEGKEFLIFLRIAYGKTEAKSRYSAAGIE